MSGYNRALLAIDRYAERKKEEDAYADFMKDYNDWMADLKNAGSIGTIAGAVIGFFASGGNPEGAKQGAFYGKQLGTAGYFSARGSDPVLEYEDLDDIVRAYGDPEWTGGKFDEGYESEIEHALEDDNLNWADIGVGMLEDFVAHHTAHVKRYLSMWDEKEAEREQEAAIDAERKSWDDAMNEHFKGWRSFLK